MRVREPARRNSTFAGPVSWMSAHRRACKRRTHDDSQSVDLVVVGGEYLGGDRRGGQFVFECAALIYGRGFAHAPSPRRCSPPRGAVHVFSTQFQQTGSVTSRPPHEGQRVTPRTATYPCPISHRDRGGPAPPHAEDSRAAAMRGAHGCRPRPLSTSAFF